MAMLGVGGGLNFDSKDNTRDVLWLGDCDEGCQLLADKLGWGVRKRFPKSISKSLRLVFQDELKELCKKEHDRIDKAKEDEAPPSKKETGECNVPKL